MDAQLSKEDLILRFILEDSFIQGKISNKLDKSLFLDQDNINIVSRVIDYMDKYKKFPQTKELYLLIPDGTKERTKFYNMMCAKVSTPEKKMLYDTIEEFIRNRKTYNILLETAHLSFEEKIDEIAPLVKKLQESVNFKLETNIGLNAIKDVPEVINRLRYVNVPIPSASAFIRGITGNKNRSGGFMRKALSMYLGQTNIGKTIHLCNDAAFAYRCGYNVLYVTLELAEEFILQRIYSNITDILYNDIQYKTEEEITSLLKSNLVEGCQNHGQIFVRDMPSTTTPADIENLITEIKNTTGIDIDFLVVDYLGKLKPVKRKNMGNFNHSLYTLGTDVAEQLRDLAIALNIAVLSASQVTRDGYDSIDSSLKNTADSAGINNTADLMIIITQNQDLKQFKTFYNHVAKNRYGPKDISYYSTVDYDHMRIEDANEQLQRKIIEILSQKQKNIANFSNSPHHLMGDTNVILKQVEVDTIKEISDKTEPKNKSEVIKEEISFDKDSDILPPGEVASLVSATAESMPKNSENSQKNIDTPQIPYNIEKNVALTDSNNLNLNISKDAGVLLPEDRNIFFNGLH